MVEDFIVYKPISKIRKIFTGGTLTPPNFMPNYYEWLSTKGKRIFGMKGSENSIANLYTCPQNKTAYIYSLTLNISQMSGTAKVEHYLRLWTLGFILMIKSSGVAGSSQSISLNPKFPLILHSGETLKVESQDTGVNASASYLGFEVKDNEIPIF